MAKTTVTIELTENMAADLLEASAGMIPAEFISFIPETERLNYVIPRMLDRGVKMTLGTQRGIETNKRKAEEAKLNRTSEKTPAATEDSTYARNEGESGTRWFVRTIPVYLKGRAPMKAAELLNALCEKHARYSGLGEGSLSSGFRALRILKDKNVIQALQGQGHNEVAWKLK